MKPSKFIRSVVISFSVIILLFQGCNIDEEVPETVPVSPSGLEVTEKSATTIHLNWVDNSDNELGFKIERSIGSSAEFTEEATVGPSVTTYTNDSLSPNTQYTYRVRAYNTIGGSEYTNTVTEVTNDTAPLRPSELMAEAVSTSTINLTWKDNSDNETGFKIERVTGSSTTFTELAVVGPDVITYANDSLAHGTQYTYRVRAYNDIGDSEYSNTAALATNDIAPLPPTELVAEAVSTSEINLTWKDNSDNETGFKIERAEGSSTTFTELAVVGPNVITYSNDSLAPGIQYTYRVSAYNITGDSGYSNTAWAVTDDTVPLPPTELVAEAVSTSEIALTWKDNSDNELGFNIERAEGTSTFFTSHAMVRPGITALNDISLIPGSQYRYRVVAFNSSGDSDYSNTAVATTKENAPIAPTGLMAVAVSSTQIDLSWNDNSDNETGFKIERAPGTSTNFTQIGTVQSDVNSYASEDLTPNTQYTYRVRAYGNSGDSEYSNSASMVTNGTPIPPTDLSAVGVSTSQIDLSWIDNSDTETGFKIERATGTSATFNRIATIVAGSDTYSDIGLEPNTEYRYRVKAFNNSGDSDYSNAAIGTTLKPLEIAVYATEDNSLIWSTVNLSWQSRVFNSGKLNLGCNYSIFPLEVECASAAIKFGSLQNQINGKSIKKATLRLYVSHLPENAGATYAVNAFSSAWSTNSITAVNQPDYYDGPQTNIEAPTTDAVPFDIDVTSIVLNWAEGRPNHGLLLRELDNGSPTSAVFRLALFESLEDNSGSARRPQIIVEFQ